MEEHSDKIPIIAAPATVVSVVGVTPAPARATVTPDTVVASPVTTQEEDRVTAGQRDTSMLFEQTQKTLAVRALSVSLAVTGILSLAALMPNASERVVSMATTALVFLCSTSTLIVGTYFFRTNHTKVGGVAAKGER